MRKRINFIWLISFLVVSIAAWGIEIFWSFEGRHYLFYAFILLCFVTSLVFLEKDRDRILQSIALFFTACADFFLILLQGEYKTLAMVFFLCAQVAYVLRTLGFAEGKKEKIVNLSVRAGLSVAIAVVTACLLWQDAQLPLYLISVVYYANLLVSIFFSFLHIKEGKPILLTAIGLLLFACCDVSIGFDFMIDIFALSKGNFIYDLMHSGVSFVAIFYPPSQALLAVSSYPKR